MYSITSYSDSSIKYNIDLDNLTCSCPDFVKNRLSYNKDNPLRLCKHLLREILINNIIDKTPELLFFKTLIEDFGSRPHGIPLSYIYKDFHEFKVLYQDDSSWMKIYDSEGNQEIYNGEKFLIGKDSPKQEFNVNCHNVIRDTFIRLDVDLTSQQIKDIIKKVLNNYSKKDNISVLLNKFEINVNSSFEKDKFEEMEISATVTIFGNSTPIEIFKFSNEDFSNGVYDAIKAYIWVDLSSFYDKLQSINNQQKFF